MKPGHNAGSTSWGILHDPQNAKNPQHYVRAFLLIQEDLEKLFEYIEPSDECLETYSFRIHELLLRTCIEIEANFKAILRENKYSEPANRPIGMKDFRRVDVSHHLSSYKASLPIWNHQPKVFEPFSPWKGSRHKENAQNTALSWYTAYNASKHDRLESFSRANFENLLSAVSGLLVLLSSQFQNNDFSAGPVLLSLEGSGLHEMEPAVGDLFRVEYPTDWSDNELYDFDWKELKDFDVRFRKFDYDAVW